MQRIILDVKKLVYVFGLQALSRDNVKIDYQPDTHELVMTILYDQPLQIQTDEVDLTLSVESLEARLSEHALRDLVDRLPPELLH